VISWVVPLNIVQAPSPNYDVRSRSPDMIVLHYTGMLTGGEALAWLCNPDSRVSAHYMVEEDGTIFALVPEAMRAWHAGASYWRGETDINSCSIGVEIVNPGHAWGYRPFPEPQIAAVIALLTDIRSRWRVLNAEILAHSDVAPDRKEDPGELFPWKRLAAAGHGLWAEPDPAPGPALAQGDAGAAVFALQASLAQFGYACLASGTYDTETAAIVAAFQRHWRQRLVDGVADGETRARLTALIALAAAEIHE
jgi:N-acetylmuramoyl-L-alanine amidase